MAPDSKPNDSPLPASAPDSNAGSGDIETASLAARDQAGDTLSTASSVRLDGPLPASTGAGERIGRYLVQCVLGQGAFGTVYLALDEELNRRVAIKVPRRERFQGEEDLRRFLDEARTVARLQHPRIVPVFDTGRTSAGLPFVALAYIPGSSLQQALATQPLSPERAAAMMVDIADAVAEAHRQGFVHRDLKPANILLDAEGNPHVADFGLAVHENSQRLRAGEFAGTVPYMSPEQVRGEVHRLDGRSDIWSLGVILYQMLSGRRPFAGDSIAQLSDEIEHRDPRPPRQLNDRLPKEVERICLKAMSKSPAQRYATAKDMADDLRAYLQAPSAASPSPASQVTPRNKPWLILSLVAGGILMTVAVAAWQGPRWWPDTPDAGQPAPVAPAVTESLRVLSLDVHHVANHNGKGGEPRGILGKDSFSARLRKDCVTVEARLSHPAYAYLIAFRPDGEMEVCFPEDESVPPSLTDRPRYPMVSRAAEYGLNEGTGLWVFAVVASDEPLPAYEDWRKTQPSIPWQSGPALVNAVLLDDGDSLETLTPTNRVRGERAKGITSLEKKPVTDLVDWLKESTGAEVIRGVGFGVRE